MKDLVAYFERAKTPPLDECMEKLQRLIGNSCSHILGFQYNKLEKEITCPKMGDNLMIFNKRKRNKKTLKSLLNRVWNV